MGMKDTRGNDLSICRAALVPDHPANIEDAECPQTEKSLDQKPRKKEPGQVKPSKPIGPKLKWALVQLLLLLLVLGVTGFLVFLLVVKMLKNLLGAGTSWVTRE